MKKIILTLLLCTSIGAYALPDCPDDITTIWHNCYGFSGMGDGGDDTYEGEWKNNVPHGQGTYIFANGDKYVGNYKDGRRNGQGTFTFPGGDKYEGNFKDEKYNGQGSYTFANGDKYVGNYKDDNFHGLGTYTFADGFKQTGFFMNGEYIPEICEGMGLSENSSGYENCINRLIDKVLD
tara:strand:- start:554 stop:1090 length:537 start_codon:yes stop_codon:yes gene_type:complete